MKRKNFVVIISSLVLVSCSSSQHISQNDLNKEPEIFVFSNVNKADTVAVAIDSAKIINNFPIPPDKKISFNQKVFDSTLVLNRYIVQVGAFSSKDRAEKFLTENRYKIEYSMIIVFNEQTNLFVVQLSPFKDYESAETARDIINKISALKNAFIITVEK